MRKVLILNRVEGGVTYGRVVKTTEHMDMQTYAHEHVDKVTRDKLMRNATFAEVTGFVAALTTGLGMSIAEGHAIDVQGRSFQTLPTGQATAVVMPPAHASLPRIDLVYASLVVDQDTANLDLPFRRLRTTAELLAGADPYPISNFNVATQRNNVAVVGVRQGTAGASPVAPAIGANEVALYQVRVEAAATVLAGNKVTDVRKVMKSLNDALVRLDTLEASPAFLNFNEAVDDRVNDLFVDSTYLTKVYNDGSGLLALDVDIAAVGPALDSRFVNATGDTMSGALRVNIGGGTDPYPGINVGVGGVNNGPAGSQPRGVYGYGQAGLGNGDVAYGGFFHANANRANSASGTTSFGIFAETGGGDTRWAGYFNGNVHIAGILTKSSGTFRMDHPVDPTKDLIHSFLESNRNGLLYWFTATLVAGEAVVDLDDALGLLEGTSRALMQNVVVLSVRHPDGTHVSDAVAVVGAAFEVTLTSEDVGDTATVVVFFAAERADKVIKLSPFVDEDGILLTEVNKPALTAEDEVQITPQVVAVPPGHPLLGHAVMTVQPSLIGKLGFRWQPKTEPLEPVVPVRSTAYVPEGLAEVVTGAPGAAENGSGVGTRDWESELGPGAPLLPRLEDEDDGGVIVGMVTVGGTATSKPLVVSNFGLTGTMPRAVVVQIKRKMSDGIVGSTVIDDVVSLVKGGVVQAVNKADTVNAWQPADVYTSYVFSGEDLADFDVDDFNDEGFGAAISVTLASADPEEVPTVKAKVDFIRIRLYYDE
jgi:hypothetical protein